MKSNDKNNNNESKPKTSKKTKMESTLAKRHFSLCLKIDMFQKIFISVSIKAQFEIIGVHLEIYPSY